MVTTKGFRDVIEIRRANKEDLGHLQGCLKPICAAARSLTVAERVDAGAK